MNELLAGTKTLLQGPRDPTCFLFIDRIYKENHLSCQQCTHYLGNFQKYEIAKKHWKILKIGIRAEYAFKSTCNFFRRPKSKFGGGGLPPAPKFGLGTPKKITRAFEGVLCPYTEF